MNLGNLTYAVARATELSRESGEVQYVGFWREKNTFCPTLVGSEIHSQVEWWATVDHFGLVNFADEDDYARWALKMERAYQAHIAATEVSGNVTLVELDTPFVEV